MPEEPDLIARLLVMVMRETTQLQTACTEGIVNKNLALERIHDIAEDIRCGLTRCQTLYRAIVSISGAPEYLDVCDDG